MNNQRSKQDVYVSVDIEADGPYPGGHSMLSLGAAAFVLPNREPVGKYEINLTPLPGATQDPDTMNWWAKFPDAWAYSTKDPVDPAEGIPQFVAWVESLREFGSPVLVTYPTWDYMWVQYYLCRFNGGVTPFGIGSMDLKTLAMAMLKNDRFRSTAKRKMPKRWFEGTPKHTHKAIEDAVGQGIMLVNMLNEHLGGSDG